MKLLIAYDQKVSYASVMKRIADRVQRLGAYVYLVRACPGDTPEQEIARMENRLNEIRQEFKDLAGIESEAHILIRGMNPGEEIVTFARDQKIDEIVIGLNKRSKVGKLLFGSTAQYVILESHCPVYIAK